LALLSLIAVSIAGGAGAGAFAAGVGKLLGMVTFGAIPPAYGTALGFGVFVVIVLTMVQHVFRVMRVTLGEWLGETWVGFKNPHIAAIISMALTMLLVASGTWIYLWQLFGASNQLMAALSLLIVSLWLKSVGRRTRRGPVKTFGSALQGLKDVASRAPSEVIEAPLHLEVRFGAMDGKPHRRATVHGRCCGKFGCSRRLLGRIGNQRWRDRYGRPVIYLELTL